jgi:hypothetical protein
MTDYGEIVLRQLFTEKVEIMKSHAQIKTKKKTLIAENEEELFWVWLEYVKNIGLNKEEGEKSC